jgi:hypothetical protein
MSGISGYYPSSSYGTGYGSGYGYGYGTGYPSPYDSNIYGTSGQIGSAVGTPASGDVNLVSSSTEAGGGHGAAPAAEEPKSKGGFFQGIWDGFKHAVSSLFTPQGFLMAAVGVAACIAFPVGAPIVLGLMALGAGGYQMYKGATTGDSHQAGEGFFTAAMGGLGMWGGAKAIGTGEAKTPPAAAEGEVSDVSSVSGSEAANAGKPSWYTRNIKNPVSNFFSSKKGQPAPVTADATKPPVSPAGSATSPAGSAGESVVTPEAATALRNEADKTAAAVLVKEKDTGVLVAQAEKLEGIAAKKRQGGWVIDRNGDAAAGTNKANSDAAIVARSKANQAERELATLRKTAAEQAEAATLATQQASKTRVYLANYQKEIDTAHKELQIATTVRDAAQKKRDAAAEAILPANQAKPASWSLSDPEKVNAGRQVKFETAEAELKAAQDKVDIANVQKGDAIKQYKNAKGKTIQQIEAELKTRQEGDVSSISSSEADVSTSAAKDPKDKLSWGERAKEQRHVVADRFRTFGGNIKYTYNNKNAEASPGTPKKIWYGARETYTQLRRPLWSLSSTGPITGFGMPEQQA